MLRAADGASLACASNLIDAVYSFEYNETYLHIQTAGPLPQWYSSLSDEHKGDPGADQKMEEGSFGDSKPVGDGIFEARIHVGAGWRIYYIVVGNELILLMHGGTKRTEKRNTETAAKGKK